MARMRLMLLIALGALSASLDACSWLDGPKHGVFRGVYVAAFEVSHFRQCGGSGWWWLTASVATFGDKVPPPMPPRFERVTYLRVKGTRSARGHYGHLNAFPYELEVHEVLEASADTVGKCR